MRNLIFILSFLSGCAGSVSPIGVDVQDVHWSDQSDQVDSEQSDQFLDVPIDWSSVVGRYTGISAVTPIRTEPPDKRFVAGEEPDGMLIESTDLQTFRFSYINILGSGNSWFGIGCPFTTTISNNFSVPVVNCSPRPPYIQNNYLGGRIYITPQQILVESDVYVETDSFGRGIQKIWYRLTFRGQHE